MAESGNGSGQAQQPPLRRQTGDASLASATSAASAASSSAVSVLRRYFAKTLRSLRSGLIDRDSWIARSLSERELDDLYGYDEEITFEQYKRAFYRGGISTRLVKILPRATWGNGFEVIEDPDPDVILPFEAAWFDFSKKFNLPSMLMRADIVSKIGHYSGILIGAPGDLQTEMTKIRSLDEIKYLTILDEESCIINERVTDKRNERFGLPENYNLILDDSASGKLRQVTHWSRIIHVASGVLQNDLYGEPMQRNTWNYVKDLHKITGAGAHAAYNRMDPGMHAAVDPEIDTDDPQIIKQLEAFEEEVKEYRRGIRNMIRTQGMELNLFPSQAVVFGQNVDCLLKLIATAKGWPERILSGSERAHLASTQDQSAFDDDVSQSREEFAVPLIDQIVNRLIKYGLFPEPKNGYDVVFPEIEEETEKDKATMLVSLATANKNQKEAGGGLLVTSNELRDKVLQYAPLTTEEQYPSDPTSPNNPPVDPAAAAADTAIPAANISAAASYDNVYDGQLEDFLSFDMPIDQRLVIIGGPRRGKSTIAKRLRDDYNIPTYCTDPASKVKDIEDGVTYLPEGLSWSESSQFVCDNWLTALGPWCIEGIATVRAIRKMINSGKADKYNLGSVQAIVLLSPQVEETLPGQESLAVGIMSIWSQVSNYFPDAIVIGREEDSKPKSAKAKLAAQSKADVGANAQAIKDTKKSIKDLKAKRQQKVTRRKFHFSIR